MGPLEGLSLAAMQNVLDTNFFGAVRLVRAVLPGMKRRRKGHIVVISSVMGLQGKPWGCLPGNPPSLTLPRLEEWQIGFRSYSKRACVEKDSETL